MRNNDELAKWSDSSFQDLFLLKRSGEINQPFPFLLAGSCCREKIRSTTGGKTRRSHVMVRIKILVVAAFV